MTQLHDRFYCVAGTCGDVQICFNPVESDGISFCTCEEGYGVSVSGCGCIANMCTWYK